MEIYILDSLFRRVEVYDVYESFIWTDRYSDEGDFQLVIDSTRDTRAAFTKGVKLGCDKSNRVMEIEEVTNSTSSDQDSSLKVTGRSLEGIMRDRLAKETKTGTDTESSWVISGPPKSILERMFEAICVLGNLDPADIIPNVVDGTLYPPDNIPFPVTSIHWKQKPDTLYNAIKTLADIYDLGFRITKDGDTSKLYFNIYSGNNRTISQSVLSPVVFTPELENVQNITELTSTKNSKNVAYVFCPAGFRIVIPADVDPDVESFERRVLMVNATDITDFVDTADLQAQLLERGLQELSKSRSFIVFDGELNQRGNLIYDRDYFLGDLVTMRNVDGAAGTMRVTEQIFICDLEGERSYPTLSIKSFIYPGSWASYTSEVWEDFNTTEFWSNAT